MKKWFNPVVELLLVITGSALVAGTTGAWFMRPEGWSFTAAAVLYGLYTLASYGVLGVVVVSYEVVAADLEKKRRGV